MSRTGIQCAAADAKPRLTLAGASNTENRPHFNRSQACGLAIMVVGIATLTALHNPVGGYVMEDGLYSKVEFLRMFREAFPVYADVSDGDLLDRCLAKHPGFKTWIREETDGCPPLAIAIVGQPTNAGIRPPPAYYGARPKRYSRYAAVSWIDQPIEFAGWVGPIILAGVICLWLLSDRKGRPAELPNSNACVTSNVGAGHERSLTGEM
jgi:hypothetical protein